MPTGKADVRSANLMLVKRAVAWDEMSLAGNSHWQGNTGLTFWRACRLSSRGRYEPKPRWMEFAWN
jgi:hypothetical protein